MLGYYMKLCVGFVAFVELVLMGSSSSARVPSVTPVFETRTVYNDRTDNKADADDPTVWVHRGNPQHSFIIGTLKRGGLDVYDLQGNMLQHIPGDAAPSGMVLRPARYNNVDLIYDLDIDGEKVDVVVASDRDNDMLRFYKVNPDAHEQMSDPLTEVTATGLPWLFVGSAEELERSETAYGLATTQTDPNNRIAYAFVSRRAHRTVAKVQIYAERGKVAYKVLTTFDLPELFTLPDGSQWGPCHDDDKKMAQVEGMVVDDFHGVLYLAQEQVGLWKTDIENPAPKLRLMDRVKEFGVPVDRKFDPQKGEYACMPQLKGSPEIGSAYLSADLEGLTIYNSGQGEGYLLASSQGSNEFVVYDRADGSYIGNFAVTSGHLIDGAEKCDGAHVVSVDFGGLFPGGLLVVQDGEKTPRVYDIDGKVRRTSNFKYVRWSDVAGKLFSAAGVKDGARKARD